MKRNIVWQLSISRILNKKPTQKVYTLHHILNFMAKSLHSKTKLYNINLQITFPPIIYSSKHFVKFSTTLTVDCVDGINLLALYCCFGLACGVYRQGPMAYWRLKVKNSSNSRFSSSLYAFLDGKLDFKISRLHH